MTNWIEFENKLKEIKKPLTFLVILINNKKIIDNENFNKAIRLYIKYFPKLVVEYKLIQLFNGLNIKPPEIMINFYKIFLKIVNLKNNLIEIKNKFPKYKKLNLNKLEQVMKNELQLFLAYFDNSNSGNNFHLKLIQYFNSEKYNESIENEINSRLSKSLKIIGINFAKFFEIPILTSEDYYELKGIEKFKFINNYYQKTKKVYQTILFNISKMEKYKKAMNILINPTDINIFIDNNFSSETDEEDIELLILTV